MARAMAGLLTVALLAGLGAPARPQTPLSLLPVPVTTAADTKPSAAEASGTGAAANAQLNAAFADMAVGPLPPPACPPAHIPGPYCEHDPLLDPPELPQPGWITEAEVRLVDPHVRYWSNLLGTVALSSGGTDTISVPGAHLVWAASPDITLGYRLPSGFGEFAISGRYFGSSGDQPLPGPDGPSSVRSRLDLTVFNFDYRSTEFSLWPWMDMKWWAGGEFANIFFDSRQTTPFAAAAAGSGIVQRHVSNRFIGFGPHAGLELACFLDNKCWSLVGRVEGADLFGRIDQGFDQTDAAVDAAGTPINGNSAYSSSQEVPTVTFQLGLRWATCPNTILFLGGQYEYYWNVGRLSNINTMAEVYDAGFVLRASFTW